MADPLFPTTSGQQPAGPPPASDTKAWAPAGGPQGATPDATPYAPVTMPDMRGLSPQARHEFRQAVNAGTREAFEAWARKHAAAPPTDPAPGDSGTPPGDGDGGDGAAPATVSIGQGAEQQLDRAALAEKLAEHGSDIQAIDLMAPDVGRFHQRLEALSDEEMVAALEQGEQDVIRRVFRGNETAYERAVDQIAGAVRAIGGDKLAKAIDESCILRDPALFQRVWLLAQNVLAR